MRPGDPVISERETARAAAILSGLFLRLSGRQWAEAIGRTARAFIDAGGNHNQVRVDQIIVGTCD